MVENTPVSRACSTEKGILFNIEKSKSKTSLIFFLTTMMVGNEKVGLVVLFSNVHTDDGLIPQLCTPPFLFHNNPTCHNNHVDGAKDGNEGKQWPALALTTE